QWSTGWKKGLRPTPSRQAVPEPTERRSRVLSVRIRGSRSGPATAVRMMQRISSASTGNTTRGISRSVRETTRQVESFEKPDRRCLHCLTLIEMRRVAAVVEEQRLHRSGLTGRDRVHLPPGPILIVVALDHQRWALHA